MEYELLALTLFPVWALLVVACGLAAWWLGRHASDSRTRALLIAAVLLVGLGAATALLFAVWGREWWTYTVPDPVGVLVMGVLPLVATGYAVWRRPDATAWQVSGIAAGSSAAGLLVLLAFGLISLVVALAGAVAIVASPRFRTRDSAFLLSVASIFGGLLVASITTPDWSPVTMGLVYLPFLLIGIYSAVVSAFRGRQARRA
ncbi:MAG TPA: hypothetical protein VLA05_07805 [Coriobacteriia bacterium]|nr:hypothetical protein [Coriobacteriia bacterium]